MLEQVVIQDHNVVINVVDQLVKKKILVVPPHAKAQNIRRLEEFSESDDDESDKKD